MGWKYILRYLSTLRKNVCDSFSSHLTVDVSKKYLCHRIRYNANIPPNIFGPFHAGWKLKVVIQQYLRQQHLDLVAGEEAARAGVVTDSPMQLIGIVGRYELVERFQHKIAYSLNANLEFFGLAYLIFVIVARYGPQLFESETIEFIWLVKVLRV